MIAQASAMLGQMAIVKYLTNTIDAEGYGIYAFGLTLAGIISMLIFGPVAQTVLRFAQYSYEKNQYTFFLRKGITIHAKLNLLIIAFVLLASFISLFLNLDISILTILTAGLLSIFDGANRSLNALNNSFRNRSTLATQRIVESIFKFSAVFLVIAFLSKSGDHALMGFTLGCACSAAINILVNYRRERPALKSTNQSINNDKLMSEMRSYGFAFPFYAIFGAVFAFSDRLIIESTLGLEQLGIYFAVYQLASAPVTVLAMLLSQLIAPVLFASHLQDPSGIKVVKQLFVLLGLFSLFYLPILALIIIFSHPVLAFFTSEEIAGKTDGIFALVSAGLFAFHLGQLALLYGQSLKKTNNYILSKALHATIFLLLTWFLIHDYSLVGVAYALIISSCFYLIFNICIGTYLFLDQKKIYHA